MLHNTSPGINWKSVEGEEEVLAGERINKYNSTRGDVTASTDEEVSLTKTRVMAV